ncbi:YeeE/YedE family protein [Verticiella sediminum]|uniref:YeeE/YedE family protein n=1 Tax=Verticiella sediminum TaxID=1247510 RepID=A0A556AIU0_9BURK|nr:YeeE/YedE family protein [Verticiella sediminum]TSH92822.1 YeeE/YedE family protein [Verticiella sediminum]
MTIDWQHFTPWASFGGGLLIGLAAALLILLNGRVAGISGIVGSLLTRIGAGERGWRWAFVAGMAVSVWAWIGLGLHTAPYLPSTAPWLVAAGLLVGLGTRYASGCTSGHGVCGLARGARRSYAATGIFMLAAFATVFLVRHVIGV